MSTKVLLSLGVMWGICLSVVPLPSWSVSHAQAKIIPNDARNESSIPIEGEHLNEYPNGYLTPERALDLALQHNPRLETFASGVEERTHLLRQAGRLTNPELELELEDFGGSGEFRGGGNAEVSVRVRQRIELGGKRQRRVEVARTEVELEKTQQRAYAIELHARVRTRVVELAAAQQQLELAQAQAELSRTLLDMVRERIDAGKAADIEQIAFEMQLSEAKLKTGQAQTEVTRAQHALAALWGESAPQFNAVALKLEQLPAQEEIEALYATLSHTPASALARTRTQRAAHELRLERARSIPDLNLSVGVKEERGSGDHAMIGGISLEIPLFERNQDGIAAARARQHRADAALRASMIEQRKQLQDGWYALTSARETAHTLRTEILPAAQEHFDAVTYAYRAGKYTYAQVLDAQQNLFELRLRHIDALGDVHRKHIELERICARLDPHSPAPSPEMTPELASVLDAGDKR